ncbi:DMT family transporter [Actinopolymorpha alba]|uniref:DMT family transporter n=1 Tax=Actinopolymorpha alba TaxID=533267 RepID=UPI000369BD70|nr:DMT family transporter [Actinopolymorpha alba]
MPRRSLAQLLVLSALWGSSYLFISLALEGVGPVFLVFVRAAGAALLLLPILWVRRASLAGRWKYLPLIALPQVVLPFVLISAGELHIDSGLAGTLIATQPLWLVVLAPALGLGRPGGRAVGGTLIGLAGVAILLGGIGTGADVHLGGATMVLAAAVLYAVGGAAVRRWMQGVDPVALTGATMSTSAVLLAPFAMAGLPTRMPGSTPVLALAVLAVACTGGAFVLYNRLIADVGPQRASLVSYLAPTFSVAYGALLLDEPLGIGTFVGLGLILLGSWTCARGPRKRRKAGLDSTNGTNPATGEHDPYAQASPRLGAG